MTKPYHNIRIHNAIDQAVVGKKKCRLQDKTNSAKMNVMNDKMP